MKQRYPDIRQQAAQNRGPYREEHQLGVSYEFPGNHTWEEFRGHRVGRGNANSLAENFRGWI